MALLSCDISELCLGKPLLKPFCVSSTIRDALSALNKTECDTYLSVWNGSSSNKCVGKISTVDIICFLCREDNLCDPLSALESPVSVLLRHAHEGIVRHVDPNTSLLEALDLITVEGVQNLVVPIDSHTKYNNSSGYSISKKKKQLKSIYGCSGPLQGYCWLTQEDVLRFFFSYISFLSPLPTLSLRSLGLIRTQEDALTVGYHEPASSALDAIVLAHAQQTSVAVVSPDGKLIGEISPSTLATCNETIAPAIATLSAGDLLAYIDRGGPPRELVQLVKAMLRERGGDMDGMLELLGDGDSWSSSSSCSSDDELSSPKGPLLLQREFSSKRRWGGSSYSVRMVQQAAEEAIVCHGKSSLVAVMVQALAHRVNYVWVIEKDYTLAGIVTFSDILNVFREHLLASHSQ
ncbi:hypothetical protein AAC387_Pa02g0358 [Persea americana]